MFTKTNIIIFTILIIIAFVLLIILACLLDKYRRMKENAQDSSKKSEDDVDLKEEKLEEVLNAGEEPDKILVPDNVKNESSTESTQNIDAPEYDVKEERKK